MRSRRKDSITSGLNVHLHVPYRWSSIDDGSVSPSKILTSDKFGRLAMISLENLKEAGIILVPLGEVHVLPFFL